MKFNAYLEKIAGVGMYPMISLLLFVIFFILVSFWAFRINHEVIKRMENIPLDKTE
jgi:cytochrome c oxidase cbb3-type subunit 3